MTTKFFKSVALVLVCAGLLTATLLVGLVYAQGRMPINRTVLPMPEPHYPPIDRLLDARNATPPPRFEVKAPRTLPTC